MNDLVAGNLYYLYQSLKSNVLVTEKKIYKHIQTCGRRVRARKRKSGAAWPSMMLLRSRMKWWKPSSQALPWPSPRLLPHPGPLHIASLPSSGSSCDPYSDPDPPTPNPYLVTLQSLSSPVHGLLVNAHSKSSFIFDFVSSSKVCFLVLS